MIISWYNQIFSAVAKMIVHRMAENEKQHVESPVCHLVATDIWHKMAVLYLIHYIHRSAVYRRMYNLMDMLGCRAVALPTAEEIILVSDIQQTYRQTFSW